MADINKVAEITGHCIAASDADSPEILTGQKGISVDCGDDHSILHLEKGKFRVPNNILSVADGQTKEDYF